VAKVGCVLVEVAAAGEGGVAQHSNIYNIFFLGNVTLGS